MSEKLIGDVTEGQIASAFNEIASDLAEAFRSSEGPKKRPRVHLDDAADAVFNYLHLKYTEDAFPKIKEVLKKTQGLGRKQYIEL